MPKKTGAAAKPAPYVDDNVRCFWELTVGSNDYWFVYDWCHPLDALKWILRQDEMDCEIDGIEDHDEPWRLRVMGAGESIQIHGDGKRIGPFPLDEDGVYHATVKDALTLVDGPMVVASTAWDS